MYQKEDIFALLERKQLPCHSQSHGAVYTMEAVDRAGVQREGIVLKNLFLKDGKGRRHFLLCVPETVSVDFAALGEQLGAKKLGLASPERLEKYLGVTQGCVSPFNALNDEENAVTVVFDQDLPDDTVVGVHPNDTTASVWLPFGPLKALVAEHGSPVVLLPFHRKPCETAAEGDARLGK